MKSNKVFTQSLLGILASTMYFCIVIFLYYAANILHVFPVFAGEDDFSVRRWIFFYTLVPSIVIFGFFLKSKRKFKESVIGMLLSSILYGGLIFVFKKYFLEIDDRDLANLGVFIYFLSFILFNVLGLFLSRKIIVRKVAQVS